MDRPSLVTPGPSAVNEVHLSQGLVALGR
jgi:hypothetical protein